MSIPQIRNDKGFPTLYVHDKPFFALSGELHNSASSSLEYMEQHVWPMLRDIHMNAVIVPLPWDQVEETEGVYDFSLMDGLIRQARENQMKIIFLWFGLWKNAESMYVPAWMKQDTQTYFRIRKSNGEPVNTISPLCQEAIEKDKACFSQIMAHLKDIDGEENTVIIMQVENEIGLLGDYRDYSPAANQAFEDTIPEVLQTLSGEIGTWREVYADQAEESFMAYYFARAVAEISQAGQDIYPLPCYANAWLRQYPWYPGSYPSGGPVREMHEIWKAVAPNLFALAPDIYVPYVADVMDEYCHDGNPLFIPEVRKDAVASSYCLYAFGKHNAICFSPFGIEELAMDPEKVPKPPMEVMIALNIDPSAFDIRGSFDCLSKTYSMITEMTPLLMRYRGSDKQQSFCRHGEHDYGTFLQFSDYDLAISYAPRESGKTLGAGIVFELSENEFLIAATRCSFTFMSKPGENARVEILQLEDGTVRDGEWVRSRLLNGDEKMTIQAGEIPEYIKVKLFKY